MDFRVEQFCQLIRNEIHDNEEICFDDGVDWPYMVQLSKDHGLFPIFVEGASKYTSYTRRSEYSGELQNTITIVAAQIKRTEAFLNLYRDFLKAGIHPIVMKGIVCRGLYGKLRDHRPSGDEDVLIRPIDYWKTKEILIRNGYIAEFDSETEAQLERVQEITYVHPKEKLHIELHLNIMGRENDMRSQMTDCFNGVFENYREVEINGVPIRTMCHHDHFLFLVLHAFKHFTTGGFGIRQLLDIMLYQKQFGAEIDMRQVEGILQNFKADVFFSDLVHLANSYFGFELPVTQEAHCPEQLLEDMLLCGSFGNKTQAERTAMETMITTAGRHWEKKNGNLIILIWKAIFPSRTIMVNYFPYLEEKPWMLPIEWIKRWGRFLKHNKENKGNLALESIKVSQRRTKILKKYDLA